MTVTKSLKKSYFHFKKDFFGKIKKEKRKKKKEKGERKKCPKDQKFFFLPITYEKN